MATAGDTQRDSDAGEPMFSVQMLLPLPPPSMLCTYGISKPVSVATLISLPLPQSSFCLPVKMKIEKLIFLLKIAVVFQSLESSCIMDDNHVQHHSSLCVCVCV